MACCGREEGPTFVSSEARKAQTPFCCQVGESLLATSGLCSRKRLHAAPLIKMNRPSSNNRRGQSRASVAVSPSPTQTKGLKMDSLCSPVLSLSFLTGYGGSNRCRMGEKNKKKNNKQSNWCGFHLLWPHSLHHSASGRPRRARRLTRASLHQLVVSLQTKSTFKLHLAS